MGSGPGERIEYRKLRSTNELSEPEIRKLCSAGVYLSGHKKLLGKR